MRLCGAVLVVGVVLAGGAAEARGPFVYQIPNGTRNTCKNCHTEPAGDSPLNPFGTLVQQRMGGSSTLDWPTLARVDSDGDGFTNGQELGDPCGAWTAGNTDPAITAAGNPGEGPSVPTGAPANDCPTGTGDDGNNSKRGCQQAGSTPLSLVVAALFLLRRRAR